jgi:hypothetical protein
MPAYKNKFQEPEYVEHKIQTSSGTLVGVLRVKPSTILWKPANARRFYSKSLDHFAEWMTAKATGARKTKQ